MNNEINSVIETLCEKFGTTAEFLVPEIARYYTVTSCVTVSLALVVSIISIILIAISCRKSNETSSSTEGWAVMFLLSSLAFVVSFIFFIIELPDFIGWLTSPYGATIHMLITLLR